MTYMSKEERDAIAEWNSRKTRINHDPDYTVVEHPTYPGTKRPILLGDVVRYGTHEGTVTAVSWTQTHRSLTDGDMRGKRYFNEPWITLGFKKGALASRTFGSTRVFRPADLEFVRRAA